MSRSRHSRLFFGVLAVWLTGAASIAAADAVPGELIVKFREGTGAARRAAAITTLPGAASVREFAFIRAEHLRFTGLSTDEAIARMRTNPDVEYAEPNYVVTADVVPNDASFSQLWGMLNTGQGGGFAGDDIDATLAWNLYTGDPNLKIGVIDTGIDYTHPDLAANIWTNPGEIAGNGVDDDGNGYVDDVHGYDVLNHDGDPMDDGSHGTHVAGTIGAVGNNSIGVTGVNWHCKMVAIKFMNASGIGSEADAIASIEYAIAVGVKVTNNSWGNMPGGQALLDAINAAGAAGQLFVCAAGNNGWNIDLVPVYPPSFLAPCMITVACTDGRDLRPTFSNFGATTVQLGAPGYGIYSCKPGNLYQSLNGTSMSAPHVTGVAALAFGMFTHATNLQIRQLILANTDPIASMAGITSTGGRLNAYKTLLNGDAIPPGRVTTLAVADTGSTSLGLRWTATGDDGAVGTATLYDLRRSSSPIDSLNFAAATPLALPAPQVAGSTETAQISGLPFSTGCYFAIRAVDELSNPGPISNIVHVTTLGIPALALAPAALALSLVPGATLDTAVIVTNPGLGRLDYTLPSPAPAGWLAASPASGRVLAGNAARVALRLDATGLTDGTYNVSLPVTSNDPVTGSQSVPVQLIVSASTAVGDPGLARFGLRLVSRNPSAGGATLELSLPAPGPVDVAVFDVRGRRIARLADGAVGAGTHTLRWDAADDRGSSVAPGVYFVRAITRGGTFERRVVILD